MSSVVISSLEAAEIKIVLTANTADLQDGQLLFATIDDYCNKEHGKVVWILNGDTFHKPTDADINAWSDSALELLQRHPHLTLLINQGDREWDQGERNGWQSLGALEEKLSKKTHPRLHFFFENGCPGPWLFSLAPNVDLILFNSQWWNHPYGKPLAYMNECPIADEDIFLEKITDLLDESKSKNVLLLSHFPLVSLGEFGGRFPASAYLLPPVYGSAKVAYHQNIGDHEDIANANFIGIRTRLIDLMDDYPSLVHASGHERNHAVLKSDKNFFIGSGALENGDFIASSRQAAFAKSDPGFLELAYDSAGGIAYRFFQKKGNEFLVEKSDLLVKPQEGRTETFRKPHTQPTAGAEGVVAGPEYQTGKLKGIWLGKHYRSSWTTPVNVPELDMDTTFQGLTILRKGGGRQTTSLKMRAGNGREYVFRSVNKDPSKALSRSIRGTIVSDLIKDQTSTQQPYGALAVSVLLDELNILHARPRLYILPTPEKLGSFSEYGNMLGMLEDSPTDKIEKERIFGHADHIERSHKLFQKLYDDHDNRVDQPEFCKARIFDILAGDWGKHEDNWKWAGYKTERGIMYRPIPRDRDHVFSRWDGILPFLADREWAKETGEDFDYTIKGLRSLMQQARHMDRLLTNQLTKEDWISKANEIQKEISDEDIGRAIRVMPEEIYQTDGLVIAAKLKARIRDLPFYAEKYYNMLAREVDVVGSNKSEYFKVSRHSDGSVSVLVCDLDKGQPDFGSVYFNRKFYPDETDEIRLYGLTKKDVFVVDGDCDRSILVRIIHGESGAIVQDSSYVKGSSKKTLIYQEEVNASSYLGREAVRVTPKNNALYDYDRTAFAYNTYFPLIYLVYNPFNGLALNGRVTFTNHNFSKPDFSAKHTISASVSARENFEVSYKNQLRYLIGKWDGISEINLSRPLNYNYFFGIGNDTQSNDEFDNDYYRAQYNALLLKTGLTRAFWNRSSVMFAGSYELADGISRAESFLADNPQIFGLQRLQLFSFTGSLDLDFRDNVYLPLRGFRLGLSGQAIHIDNSKDDLAAITQVKLEHYLSTYNSRPLTLGISAGAGWTSGELPFYKLFSLGQLNDLHGFKRNRYTGESKAYLNSELRWQVVETSNTLIPLKAGVRAFYDVGRVWAESDPASADYWHHGYGGGFYVTPFMDQFSFNVNFGFSKEEPFLLMFGIGGFF